MPRPREFDEDKVLLKAMELFWEKGFEGTSVRDVTEATGLSPSSLYSTFGDKRSLYLRAFRCYLDKQLLTAVRDSCKSSTDVAGCMEQLLLSDPGCRPGGEASLGCFLTNCIAELCGRDTEVSKIVLDVLKNLQAEFEKALAGKEKPENVRNRAVQVLSMMLGLHLLRKADFPEKQVADSVKDFFKSTVFFSP